MLYKIAFFVVFFQVLQNSDGFARTNSSQTNEVQKKVSSKGSTCVCSTYNCGCCVYLNVPKINLNDTGCVNVSYLPKEYGIRVTVTIDDFALINMSMSARNPPPICFGDESLVKYADICLEFYDLNATLTSLHGCVEIDARLSHVKIAKYDLGCFDLGKKSKTGMLSFKSDIVNRTKDGLTYIPKKFAQKWASKDKLKYETVASERKVVDAGSAKAPPEQIRSGTVPSSQVAAIVFLPVFLLLSLIFN